MTPVESMKLSYTRLRCYERCPRAYKLRYVDQAEHSSTDAMAFGSAVHVVLEQLLQEHIELEVHGPLSVETATELWTQAWRTSKLQGLDLFAQGMLILKSFITRQGMVDPHMVLAVEAPFEIRVGRFTVVGTIDRVDKVDEGAADVVDYKTSHAIPTPEELNTNLQLGLYRLAASQLWPWAKRITSGLEMLHHGVRQRPSRAPSLETVEHYVMLIGEAIEADETFAPRVTPNCVNCAFRRSCDAYLKAVHEDDTPVAGTKRTLANFAREHDYVSNRARLLYARRRELDELLKAHLSDTDELVVGQTRYTLYNDATHTFPLSVVLEILGRELLDESTLLERVHLNESELEALLEIFDDRSLVRMLEAELAVHAETTHRPKLWAKELPW